uniref:Uncharacterized protein n=1 Tax=Molossus molossus TaxID=27622 RepID=A0A7J8CZF3_MOLMO|nr:hypothetical protein HJG59_009421 [Molossus molossus]
MGQKPGLSLASCALSYIPPSSTTPQRPPGVESGGHRNQGPSEGQRAQGWARGSGLVSLPPSPPPPPSPVPQTSWKHFPVRWWPHTPSGQTGCSAAQAVDTGLPNSRLGPESPLSRYPRLSSFLPLSGHQERWVKPQGILSVPPITH